MLILIYTNINAVANQTNINKVVGNESNINLVSGELTPLTTDLGFITNSLTTGNPERHQYSRR